ncbi:MAG: tannase/feruloyl esterase family alpha/beta hydrolase, partial [Polymorphobacter sp.]
FPGDFDGIVAGAPAYAWTRMMGAVATATATMLAPGRALPPAKLPALQAAALKACGHGRSWIADPRACRFDPGVLACTGAETDACLTAGQLASVRMIYGGAPDATGTTPFPGLMPGAEAGGDGWAAWGVARAPGNEVQAARSGYAWNFYANMVKGDRALDLRALTAADIIAGDRQWRATINADAADLSAFRAHGGKLIAYHGWNDAAIPPGLTLDYVKRVGQQMGPTGDFLRLFMVPGMLHCNGGNAPVAVDWLALLESWVETGAAPATVTARGNGAVQTLAYERSPD